MLYHFGDEEAVSAVNVWEERGAALIKIQLSYREGNKLEFAVLQKKSSDIVLIFIGKNGAGGVNKGATYL